MTFEGPVKPWYDERSMRNNPQNNPLVTLSHNGSSLEDSVQSGGTNTGNGFLRRSLRFAMPAIAAAAFYVLTNVACNTQATPVPSPTNTPRPTATAVPKLTFNELLVQEIRSINPKLADAIEAADWYTDGQDKQEEVFLGFLYRLRWQSARDRDPPELQRIYEQIGSDNDRLVEIVQKYPDSVVMRHVTTPLSEFDLVVGFVEVEKARFLRMESDGSISLTYMGEGVDRSTAEYSANIQEYGVRKLEEMLKIPAIREARRMPVPGNPIESVTDEQVIVFINSIHIYSNNPQLIQETVAGNEHTMFHELTHDLYGFGGEFVLNEGITDYLAWLLIDRLVKENPPWFVERSFRNYSRAIIYDNLKRRLENTIAEEDGNRAIDIPIPRLFPEHDSLPGVIGYDSGYVLMMDLERIMGLDNVLNGLSRLAKLADEDLKLVTYDAFYKAFTSAAPTDKLPEVDALLQKRIYGK